MRNQWHIIREGGALTLARQLPPRFDVVAEVELPAARKGRLAQQIRQDLWRALQGVRGFSPVVRIEEDGSHLRVRAGGSVNARTFPKADIESRIATLLSDTARQSRWLAHARPVK
ncbi:hypothetical protein [Actibacterium lipolyticum]|uniref:Uncharacterized protein n=1 Tax=Actibacterium lipolyticum TaxID=1524263 RepID=A0A238JQ26_9RHOB|nr:hypothetical protein [Actibacterium lipolyticum]SMX32645.1 hypothetical protein COL8621_00867 [Actibacterium lipolyticum]